MVIFFFLIFFFKICSDVSDERFIMSRHNDSKTRDHFAVISIRDRLSRDEKANLKQSFMFLDSRMRGHIGSVKGREAELCHANKNFVHVSLLSPFTNLFFPIFSLGIDEDTRLSTRRRSFLIILARFISLYMDAHSTMLVLTPSIIHRAFGFQRNAPIPNGTLLL